MEMEIEITLLKQYNGEHYADGFDIKFRDPPLTVAALDIPDELLNAEMSSTEILQALQGDKKVSSIIKNSIKVASLDATNEAQTNRFNEATTVNTEISKPESPSAAPRM
jgi:hypothetical protein